MEFDRRVFPKGQFPLVKEIFWQMVPMFKSRLRLRPPKPQCETSRFAPMASGGWCAGFVCA
eukprot:2155018-Pyramimonas_sp.AAC.1